MRVIDNKTREHGVAYTNQVRLRIIGSPSHEFIIIVFYDERAILVSGGDAGYFFMCFVIC